MSARTSLAALTVSALLAACGGSGSHKAQARPAHRRDARVGQAELHRRPRYRREPGGPRRRNPPPEQALVTAETENRLLVVDLPSGRVVRRIPLPPDPEDIAAAPAAERRRRSPW